jgi:Rrf2 family protein
VKLSTREEYGLRLLLQIARHEAKSLTLADLSRFEGIPQPNVAKLMRTLRKAGFVNSTRGQAGGYTLSRLPEEISIGEALAALGGRFFDSKFCERHAGIEALCMNLGDCSIRPVLRQLQVVVDQVLERLTLKSLLVREHEMVIPFANPKAVVLPISSRPN